MTRSVLLAGLFHETHTFLADKTKREDFVNSQLSLGQEVIDINQDNGSPASGFLSVAREKSWKVIPSILMQAMPSGMVEHDVVDEFCERIEKDLSTHLPSIDAIYLVLHGAMVSTNSQDVEGEVLEKLRSTVSKSGRKIPICGVLDLHCNFSQKMADHSDCLVSYQKNPHTDARDAAMRAANILDKIMVEGLDTHTLYRHPPLLFSPKGTGSSANPMLEVLEKAREWEAKDPSILCINVFGGFAYADIEDAGFSVTCTTTGDRGNASMVLDELCSIAEVHREAGHPVDDPLPKVIEKLPQNPEMPILIIEASDNIGAGTPGDGTVALESLINTGFKNIVAVINDPEVADECHKLGSGEMSSFTLGAKTDEYHGQPIEFEAQIIHVSQGSFQLEDPHSHLASMFGTTIEMGKCATLQNDSATILITSLKTPPMDLGQLRSQGIVPEDASYIVVKAAVSHKQAYDPIALASHYVDTPGLGTSNLKSLPYRNIKRPIFPLDEI